MRHLLWVLLAGLLATAIAQAQEQSKPSTSTVIHLITEPFNRVQNRRVQEERLAAIERLAVDTLDTQQQTAAEVVEPEEEATHKTAQGILEAVGDIVASLSPSPEMPAPEATSDSIQPNGTVAEASESAVPSETEETPTETNETVLTETNEFVAEEVEDTPTEAPSPEEEQPAEEVKLTKKERKAVRMYNTAVDQVLVILSKKLNEVGPIPIALDEESLLALDAEEEPEPEPGTTPKMTDSTRTRKKGNKKNRKNNGNNKNNKKNNRRRNQNRKNNNKDEGKSNGQTRRNKKNNSNGNNKGNKNKPKNKNADDNNSGEKNNNNSREKNNNGRRRNKKNNRNQGNNNRRNNQNKDDASHLRREPKALDDNVEMTDIAQGRRKDSQAQPLNNQSGGNNRKANKRNKKKNKNNNTKNNKGRMDLESRADTGPSLPTAEELSQSNGLLTGLAKLTRNGDVRVDLSSKKQKINADITIGPLEVNLKDKTKALTKAQVTTSLTAEIAFKVRSVRGRNKIHIEGIEVTELLPEEVGVTRSDLELEDEVVTLAKQQVVGAVDTARVGRILSKVLTNIFDEDNIVENLDSHPLLSRK